MGELIQKNKLERDNASLDYLQCKVEHFQNSTKKSLVLYAYA